MSKMVTKAVVDAIRECGREYNFDGEAASSKWLSLHVSVSESVSVKEVSILPFSGEYEISCCESVRHNRGLYTQCESKKESGSELCKRCNGEVTRNGGVSMFGTMTERKAVGIMEYKDPKGRSPVRFMKVMRKLKLTREMVEEDAKKKGRSIAEVHFEESVSKRGRPSSGKEVKEKKAKGRPSKSKKVLEMEDETVDLFANMVKNAVIDESSSSDEEVIEEVEEKVVEKEVEKDTKVVAKAAEKEQEKVAKAAEKEQEKAAKAAEKEQEKAAKAAEKEQEKLAKEQEKIAKAAEKEAEKLAKEQEKIAKAAEKEQEKLAKEQEKIAKAAEKEAEKLAKEQEKIAKAAEKEAKAAAKLAKKETVKEPKVAAAKKEPKVAAVVVAVPAEEDEEDSVVEIDYEGKKYLKSIISGTVYDMEENEIGKWNNVTKKIDLSDNSDCDEEEEEEYE